MEIKKWRISIFVTIKPTYSDSYARGHYQDISRKPSGT